MASSNSGRNNVALSALATRQATTRRLKYPGSRRDRNRTTSSAPSVSLCPTTRPRWAFRPAIRVSGRRDDATAGAVRELRHAGPAADTSCRSSNDRRLLPIARRRFPPMPDPRNAAREAVQHNPLLRTGQRTRRPRRCATDSWWRDQSGAPPVHTGTRYTKPGADAGGQTGRRHH
jgi:hypothetical protein